MSLCSPPPASADEEPEKTEVMGPAEVEPMEGESSTEKPGEDPGAREEEEETEEPGDVEILEVELTPEELWMLTDPWEEEGITVHDAGSGGGEPRIPSHGGGKSGEDITTHTQTSGDEQRIPVTRIGESNDDDIVVHGGSREGPSRIRVH
jgi:hypothetical protein